MFFWNLPIHVKTHIMLCRSALILCSAYTSSTMYSKFIQWTYVANTIETCNNYLKGFIVFTLSSKCLHDSFTILLSFHTMDILDCIVAVLVRKNIREFRSLSLTYMNNQENMDFNKTIIGYFKISALESETQHGCIECHNFVKITLFKDNCLVWFSL